MITWWAPLRHHFRWCKTSNALARWRLPIRPNELGWLTLILPSECTAEPLHSIPWYSKRYPYTLKYQVFLSGTYPNKVGCVPMHLQSSCFHYNTMYPIWSWYSKHTGINKFCGLIDLTIRGSTFILPGVHRYMPCTPALQNEYTIGKQ